MQKTLRYRELRFNTEHERPSMTARDNLIKESEDLNESIERIIFKTDVDDGKANSKKF
jgi:hypothetical protein